MYSEKMGFLVVLLLLVLYVLNKRMLMAVAWVDEDFFSNCPPSSCSQHGPEIRFPFQLESGSRSSLCGELCMKLACFGEDTILVESALAGYKVTAIDYRRGTLTITPPVNLSSCQLIEKLNSASVRRRYPFLQMYEALKDIPFYYTFYSRFATVVSCSRKFTPGSFALNDIAGPIPCLSNAAHISYLVDSYADMSVLPLDCKVVSDGMIPMPDVMLDTSVDYRKEFKEVAEQIINISEMTVRYEPLGYNCVLCERPRSQCAFSSQMNNTFCMHRGMVSEISVGILL